ncbi:MAG: hypothetical protein JWO94_3935 [Verrucomicrobiaceae bacterium]|nr:hypothetical protein [Verrucomicrobiaceae bacterium]
MAKKTSAKKAAAATSGKSGPAKPAPSKSVESAKPASKKAVSAPAKTTKPASKKAAKVAAKAAPAEKTSPKTAAKTAVAAVKKPLAKTGKSVPKEAVKAAATIAKAGSAQAKTPSAPAKTLSPSSKKTSAAVETAQPAVKTAKAASPTAVAKPEPSSSTVNAAATPKADSKPGAVATPAAAAPASAKKTAGLPLKPLFPDRPRSMLGVAALPPGGMPEWWRWHQEYPGEETLRRGTVLTSFNVYAGLYTDTLRIHMAAGQSGIRAVSYSSKLTIHGGGSGGKQKGDTDYKDTTALHLNDGNPPSKKNALNSLEYPFAVLPLPPKSGNTLHFQALGLDVGDIGIAFFGRGQAAAFIYGDEGPALQVGEGSVQMAKDLGMDWESRMNTSPANGGFNEKTMRDYAPGVLHVAFPGSRDRADRFTDILTRETLQTKAWELFKRWKQSLRGGAL